MTNFINVDQHCLLEIKIEIFKHLIAVLCPQLFNTMCLDCSAEVIINLIM